MTAPVLSIVPELSSTERLIEVIQQLSLARTLDEVMRIVRTAARQLTRADGATFVLRDGTYCFYADEDAVGPLWKGRRFPLTACISGWSMIHRQSVAIQDIYQDERIPADAYRPTFVKSLVMVPVRVSEPIAAIGVYWASHHSAQPAEVQLLQALANSTSIALQNVELVTSLEAKVRERTEELTALNRDLESFSYSVSHDLRAPLRAIEGFGQILEEDVGESLSAEARQHLQRIRDGAAGMGVIIEALLGLSRVTQRPVRLQRVDLSSMAAEVVDNLRRTAPERRVWVSIQEGLTAEGDAPLLRILLTNLLANAWKFTRQKEDARIEVGTEAGESGPVFYVRDNGAGFDMKHVHKLFAAFQRLHDSRTFEGTGIGLATVARVVRRHRGKIWAEGVPGEGATFRFELHHPVELLAEG